MQCGYEQGYVFTDVKSKYYWYMLITGFHNPILLYLCEKTVPQNLVKVAMVQSQKLSHCRGRFLQY